MFERWWPDLERRLSSVPKAESPPAPARGERELLEELLQLVRKDRSSRSQPRQGYDDYIQKNAVWKALHDLTEGDISAMSAGALQDLLHALHNRWKSTDYVGEERTLELKLEMVQAELRRRNESVAAEPKEGNG